MTEVESKKLESKVYRCKAALAESQFRRIEREDEVNRLKGGESKLLKEIQELEKQLKQG